MRILFVVSYLYLPQSRAGTETNTDELCTALQKRGHTVAVLAGVSRRSWAGVRNTARCLIRFTHCSPPDEICGYPVFRSPYGITDLRKSLDDVLAYFRPDVVVTQLRNSVCLAYQAHSKGIPAVVYLHDINFGGIGRPRSENPTINFMSNSKFTAKKLRDDLGMESFILYNIFNPEKYRANLVGRHVTFVNPHPAKGVETALSLAEKSPHIPFLFVGSYLGSPEKTLKRRANDLPNIDWVATTSDIRSIYARTRIVIVPSRVDESWGRVATEAQFSGIPVLASDRGGLRESVGEGGILLPDEDLSAWQIALEDLWDNDRRWNELSHKALRHAARSEIQPATVMGRFLDFLQQVRTNDWVAA